MYFSKDFIRLVDEGDVEPLDLDPSIPVLEERPAFFWENFILSTGEDISIRIILAASCIDEDVVDVIDEVELGDGTGMLLLLLYFFPRRGILAPIVKPRHRN